MKGSLQNVGGVIGNASNTNITKCLNYVQVEGKRAVGGIVGLAVDGGFIAECGNSGMVLGSWECIGGIGGLCCVDVSYCYNKGSISGDGSAGGSYSSVGGIVGLGRLDIKYCYNTGNVYGATGQVAGIVGDWFRCGDYLVSYCYNSGVLSCGTGEKFGSIAGQTDGSKIADCYWTNELSCRGNGGTDTNCKKLSDDEMKAYTNKAFVLDNVAPLINKGYPVLYWEKGLTIEQE